MLDVNGLCVRITRGDSGLLTIRTRGNHAFTERDRAVFTVRRRGGGVLMCTVLTPDGRGQVQVPFESKETEGFKPGMYEWDIRYVLDAVIGEDGTVSGGREVITPMRPGEFEVLKAVGKV